MFRIVALVLIMALGACEASDMYRGAFAAKGAEAADDVLESSVWGVCQAATIGAVRRAYGGSSEQARKYAAFCGSGSEGTADLVSPNDSATN